MKFAISLLGLLSLATAYGQSPLKLWEVYHDGSLTGKDMANALVIDPSGNIYVTGRCYQTANGGNFTTVKYDANGNQQWVDHYNGTSANGANRGISMVMDQWNNIYVIGTVSSNQGDIAIVKYNPSGMVWSKSYEPYWFGSAGDFGVGIAVDTLGHIYAAGQITSLSGNLYDLYVMKCDSNGDKIFEDDYSSANGDDYTGGIAVTPAGDVFALTTSFNFFGTATYDITTIHYLENGAHNWLSSFDGEGSASDYGTFIKADHSLNQYVGGTSDEGPDNDMVVMKQNKFGTRLWVVKYNGTANGNDTATMASPLSNGYVAVTGRSRELVNGNIITACTTMMIDSGTVLWTNTFYGNDLLGAAPAQMATDESGNTYICGSESLDYGTKNGYVLKYDLNGNQIWTVSFDAGNGLDDKFNSMAIENNDIVVTGQSYFSSTSSNYVTVKYHDLATTVNSNYQTPGSTLPVYPNPVKAGGSIFLSDFQPETEFEYVIYSPYGHLIDSGKLTGSRLPIKESIESGLYLLMTGSDGHTSSHKLMIHSGN